MKIDKVFSVFSRAVQTELKTDAGKVNFLALICLVITAAILFLPDAITIISNAILAWNGKPLPQVSGYTHIFYLIIMPLFMVWCVWFVNRVETNKKKK